MSIKSAPTIRVLKIVSKTLRIIVKITVRINTHARFFCLLFFDL